MKYNYPPLEGLCNDCLYKCNRVEEPNFKGIWRCEYYIREEKKNEKDRNTIQTTIFESIHK